MTRQAGKIPGWYRRSSSQRSCGIRYPGLYPAIPSSLRLFHLHNYSTNTNTHSGSKLLGINEFIDLRRTVALLAHALHLQPAARTSAYPQMAAVATKPGHTLRKHDNSSFK